MIKIENRYVKVNKRGMEYIVSCLTSSDDSHVISGKILKNISGDRYRNIVFNKNMIVEEYDAMEFKSKHPQYFI